MQSDAQATGGVSAGAWRRAAPWILAVAGALAYSNSFGGEFVFDDAESIPMNESIRSLWPPWKPLRTPKLATVSGRPILNLSFAINYAIHGLDTRGYHAGNLLIHLGAAALLFGIARRTMLLPSLRARWGERSAPLALAIALLWMLHPIHTASVTYMVQRAESLVGFFYLLTLYLFIRGADSPRPRPWLAASVAACAVGMGCKEIMITAPAMVLVYDRCHLSGGHLRALRRRRFYYTALASTMPLLAYGLLIDARDTEIAMQAQAPLEYMLNQSRVILMLLRLVLWPTGMALDYGLEFAKSYRELIVSIGSVAALVGLALWLYIRSPRAGFLGAWFLGVISTVSIAPLPDLIYVHRVYLSSAAVVALAVVALASAADKTLALGSAASLARRWLPIGMIAAAAAVLGLSTFARNRAFQSLITVWTDVVRKRPNNPRGYANLGFAHQRKGELGVAEQLLARAVQLKPRSPEAIFNLALIAQARGDFPGALARFDAAIQLAPGVALFHYMRANLLAAMGRREEAARGYLATIHNKPTHFEAENNLGSLLAESGQFREAIPHFQRAVEINPMMASARRNLGTALGQIGDVAGAIEQFSRALQIDPNDAAARGQLQRLMGTPPSAAPPPSRQAP